MKKQPILIIANGIIGIDPGLSGGDFRLLEIAKHWIKSGRDVQLMSSEAVRGILKKHKLKIPVHIIPSLTSTSNRLDYIFRTLQILVQSPKNFPEAFPEGIVYSANDSLFDVIPALKLKLKYKNSIKWAALVHLIPPFPPWKRKKSTIINSIFFYINIRIGLWMIQNFADTILPVSDLTAYKLKKLGTNMNKVHPVYCGVNYDEINKVILKNKISKKYDAVFMKRIQAVKGAFDLIYVWEKIVQIKPKAKLLLIGDEGDDSAAIRKLIKEKSLSKNIIFAGYIFDMKKKFQLLSSAKIFLHPSYEENWAIVIGESLAAGLPVVAYNLEELQSIWGKCVQWVTTGNTAQFAKKTLQLMENANLRKKISKYNDAFIRKYEWRDIAKKELNIIEN